LAAVDPGYRVEGLAVVGPPDARRAAAIREFVQYRIVAACAAGLVAACRTASPAGRLPAPAWVANACAAPAAITAPAVMVGDTITERDSHK